MNARKALFQAGVLADIGNLLVIIAAGFESTGVGVTLDTGCVVGRVTRTGRATPPKAILGERLNADVGGAEGDERG